MKRLVFAGLLCLGLAMAHADYKSSVPAAGATVKTAPRSVVINFTQAVEVKLSTFKVYPLNAPQEAWSSSTRLRRLAQPLVREVLVLKGDAARRIDSGVSTSARTAQSVSLSLKPGLAPGAYVVMWKVLGVDGHAEPGYFVFVYKP